MQYGSWSLNRDQWSTYTDTFDACTSDLLAVIELNALEALATLQVFQSIVSDQWAIIQFDHLQPLLTTNTAAQMSDAIVSNQLAMRQTLEYIQKKPCNKKNRILIIEQYLKILCVPHLKPHQRLKPRAVYRKLNQCVISHLKIIYRST